MVIYATTQYTIHCDICGDGGEVMNQGDPHIWKRIDAIKEWRNQGWKISNNLNKCPKCSQTKAKEKNTHEQN